MAEKKDFQNRCTVPMGNTDPSWRITCEAIYLAKLNPMKREIELAHPNRAKRRGILEAEIARLERDK